MVLQVIHQPMRAVPHVLLILHVQADAHMALNYLSFTFWLLLIINIFTLRIINISATQALCGNDRKPCDLLEC